ncbi:hypothetical protein OK016_16685 [Vibrio chagasii]|nr:hypothetical protein [Vibrio chagasii]
MIAVKDIFWLEHNPTRLLDGTGKISVIKEVHLFSALLGGCAIVIMTRRQLINVFCSQECALNKVTNGEQGVACLFSAI